MKGFLYNTFVFLSIFATSCNTLSPPMEVSGFKIKVVNAVSRAPVSNVDVNQITMHHTGRKSIETEKRTLGATNSQGIIHIEKLNLKARYHTFVIQKLGYETMNLVVRELSGQYVGFYSRKTSKINREVTITDSTVVTIPMPRK